MRVDELIYLLNALDPDLEIGLLEDAGSMKLFEPKLKIIKSQYSLFNGEYIRVEKYGRDIYTIEVG